MTHELIVLLYIHVHIMRITTVSVCLFVSLFSGFVPRVIWISVGGFIFLGAYDKSRHHLMNLNF